MTVAYLDLAEFKLLTVMPSADVDALDLANTGWFTKQFEIWSDWINRRLSKRYAVPFNGTPNAPSAVQAWLERIVTVRAYLKRGVDPNDEQWQQIKDDAEKAMEEVKEAANAEEGLFELPLTDDGKQGVTRGGPFCYSEQSPYVWTDVQSETAREEDKNRSGSE